jgi:hypothetical protein
LQVATTLVYENPHRDYRLGSPLGRLRLAGKISEGEFRAGLEYQRVYLTYLYSIGAPQPFGPGRGEIELSDEQCDRIKEQYLARLGILQEKGRRVLHAVNAIAVFEEPEELGDSEFTIAAAQVGLAALAKHYHG